MATVKELHKQWQATGMPRDAASINNLLADAGLHPEQITQAFEAASVPVPVETRQAQQQADTQKQHDEIEQSKPSKLTPADAGLVITSKNGTNYLWKGQMWVNQKTNSPVPKDWQQKLHVPGLAQKHINDKKAADDKAAQEDQDYGFETDEVKDETVVQDENDGEDQELTDTVTITQDDEPSAKKPKADPKVNTSGNQTLIQLLQAEMNRRKRG